MKLDALDHPKTLDFAARLNVSRATAIGHLELFWHFVAKKTPRGNIGKFPDGAIARACDWNGDPEVFLKSLLKSGLMDASSEHRYLVHDWPEHCPNWVRAQLQKLKQTFYVIEKCTEEGTEERTEEGSLSPSTRARVPREGKGSQGKPREAMPREGMAEPVDNLNGHAPGPGEDFSSQSAPPEEPLNRRGAGAERKNGAFEDINDAVSKVLADGGLKPGQYHEIARMAGITPLQAEISVRQLRDRGRLPAVAA